MLIPLQYSNPSTLIFKFQMLHFILLPYFNLDNLVLKCHFYSPKKVTHNILVYRQVQIMVAVTCVLYILSYVIEYKE